MGPDLWELFEDGSEMDEIAAIIRLGHSAVVPQDVRLVSEFGEIITVRLKRGSVPRVSGAMEVASMVAGDSYLGPEVELDSINGPELSSDTVLPTDERRPKDEKATGRGVVVGVVDWGFDFAHPDFRNADGSTRILALWDQRGGKRSGSPPPYGYGVLHDQQAINEALKQKDPYAALGYHPADADTGIGCHGTHVLSIAAGSGRADCPAGIAPESDLILVHTAPFDERYAGRLGDSVTLLEAIDFIAKRAGAQPWVINLSMGRHGEQHDGSTLVEQGFDAALRMAPGRAICNSAGNYFDKRIHASGQLRSTEEKTLIWEVNTGQPTDNELEVWYSWQDKFEIAVRSPDHSIAARVIGGERAKLLAGGKEIGNIYHHGQEPNSLDNHVHLYLYKAATPGEWKVTLTGVDVIDGRFHAWIERDVSCPKSQSHFRSGDADPHCTTGTICNGRRTIAVGAYNNHDPALRISRFSSVGPTRDGRLKPDLCAPGVSVLAARSAPRPAREDTPLLTRMSGTSMAAPHVTGTVALMFEVAPQRLRIEETHNLLLMSAERVSVPEEVPDRIGIGYLDVQEAVKAARAIGSGNLTFKGIAVQPTATPCPNPPQGLPQVSRPGAETWETSGECFEGRAEEEWQETKDEMDENTFHRIASDITSAFEGGQTGTLNLHDNGIISYGKHQATLAAGALYPILARYVDLSSSPNSIRLSDYLDRVRRRDESLREDPHFIQLLKDAAKEPEMSRAQDEEFDRLYWKPAAKMAAQTNVKSALGYVIFYDTRIQGGLDQVLKSTLARLGGKVGAVAKGKEIGEQEFLHVFMDERIQRLLRISEQQEQRVAEFTRQAQALEDASASQSDHAAELKAKAAQMRRKAKQYAANAAALQASAHKTRGPSLMALVDSGDLDLMDGDRGKIYLRGRPGLAVTSLKRGAVIEAVAAAGMEYRANDAGRAPRKVDSDDVCSACSTSPPTACVSAQGEKLANAGIPEERRKSGIGAPNLGQGLRTAGEAALGTSAELVEMADQIVRETGGRLAPVVVLHEMLSRAGKQAASTHSASGLLSDAARIFDSVVYLPGERSSEQLLGSLEVVALPGTRLEQELRSGDVMLRRGEGEMAHVAVIAEPKLKSLETVLADGLTPENFKLGCYAQVVEAGIRPHTFSDRFARQLTDSAGRLLNDILLLRLSARTPAIVTVQQPSPIAPEPERENKAADG